MKKNIVVLTSLVCVLIAAQLACSLPEKSNAQDDSAQTGNTPGRQATEISEIQLARTPAQPEVDNQTGNTPLPGNQTCSDGFIGNANIANGQIFQPGESFQVVWTLENTGDCTWSSGYALKLLGAEIISVENALPLASVVNPGGSTTLSVGMQAPAQPGNYLSAWKMQDAQGHVFGQDTPPNSPLRVAIKVLPPQGAGITPPATPNPTAEPTPNPTSPPTPNPTTQPNPDTLIQGSGQTLLDGQCFDLISGQEVACNDSAADIRYQFALFGKIYGESNTNLAGSNQNDAPDKADCENQSYSPPIPHTVLEEKFFCFEIAAPLKTYYGWIRVERFDADGITFDFTTFTPNMPVPQPIIFVESQGEQVTMLLDECFNLKQGVVLSNCGGAYHGFIYQEAAMSGPRTFQVIAPHAVEFAYPAASEPSKTDCQNESYTSDNRMVSDTDYYCYVFSSGSDTYYGWLRPTSHNNNGITFDYLTWEAFP